MTKLPVSENLDYREHEVWEFDCTSGTRPIVVGHILYGISRCTDPHIVMPDGVSFLSSLTSDTVECITLGDAMECINFAVFNGCSRLREIYYPGTQEDLFRRCGGFSPQDISRPLVVHCTDGDVSLPHA